jgi:4-amino-4-deoxy-L-arabinose transferase-like glycosyltransferase
MMVRAEKFHLSGAISRNKTMLFIMVLALAVRLTFFFMSAPWEEHVLSDKILKGDALSYHRLGLSIARTGSFSHFDTDFFVRTPGYPLFIAIPYYFWGAKPWIILLLQIIIDTATVLITYAIAKELFDSRIVWNAAAILYAISPIPACLAIRLLSEILFIFVMALSILFFVRAMKSDRKVWYAVTGFTIGLATLVRPVAQFVPVIISAIILFQRKRLVTRFYHILILAVAFSAALFPWQMRNKLVHGYFALSSMGGTNLAYHKAALVKATVENISYQAAQEQLIGNSIENIDNPFERSRICRKIAVKYFLSNPMSTLKLSLKGSALIFLTTEKQCIMDLLKPNMERANVRDIGYDPSEGIVARVVRAIKKSPREFFIIPILGGRSFSDISSWQ